MKNIYVTVYTKGLPIKTEEGKATLINWSNSFNETHLVVEAPTVREALDEVQRTLTNIDTDQAARVSFRVGLEETDF